MGLNSLLASGSDFANAAYTGTRTALGTYAGGDYTAGSTSALAFNACERPVTGAELEVLGTTQHSENTRKLYSETELHTRTETHEPDEVTIDSATWVVIRSVRVKGFGETHYKVFLAKKVISGA